MLALVVLAVLLSQVPITGMVGGCEVDGQQWRIEVTGEQLRAAPHWATEGPVPLQPDGAVCSAKRILPVMVSQVENWQVENVELVRAGGSYFYEVHFAEVSPRPGMRDRQAAEVAVLLDGTGITPTRGRGRFEVPETPRPRDPSIGDVPADVGHPDRREPTSAEEVKPVRLPARSARFTGVDGRQWEAVATAEQIVATPHWTTDGPAPLPPDGAVRSAERLFPVVGMQVEHWSVDTVSLGRFADQSWVYIVAYMETSLSPGMSHLRQAQFLVLLDGTGIIPTVRHDKLQLPETSRRR
jgi:hypothetical protein